MIKPRLLAAGGGVLSLSRGGQSRSAAPRCPDVWSALPFISGSAQDFYLLCAPVEVSDGAAAATCVSS